MTMKLSKTTFTIISLIPLIFFCTLYPLITRLFLYDSGYEAFDWFDKTTQVSDLFLYWKLIAMEITGVVMCIILVFGLAKKYWKVTGNRIIYLLLGYALLTFVSTIVSEYAAYGWVGAYEQFEPVWCTLIYVLIVVYICCLVRDPRQVRILVFALAIGSFVLGVIGALQFFGIDLVTSSIGKFFIMPADLRNARLEGEGFKGLTYMTLYNPNYVGSYVCLLLPLFFSFAVNERDKRLRVLYVTDCILLYLTGLGCKSDSARWGMILILALMIALWLHRISDIRGRVALVLISSVAILGIHIYYTAGIDAFYSDTSSVEQVAETATAVEDAEDNTEEIIPISENLKGIETLDNALHVEYGNGGFYISYSVVDNEFYYDVTDEDGAFVTAEQVENQYLFQITDPRFMGVQFAPVSYEDGSFGLQLIIDGKKWNFTNESDGEPGYYYYNEFGKFDKITNAENYLFKDHGSFGNGRGFIWGETLAMLKHTLVLGTGADSFALAFPQDNYVEKYLNGYETLIITKPHNMYLQIAVQNGVLALILFLVAVLIYLYKAWRSYQNKDESDMPGLQTGIAAGMIGYLFTGLVNDATICITPIFWCLFGLGIMLTSQYTTSKKKNKR